MNILEKLYDIIKIIKINPLEVMKRRIYFDGKFSYLDFDHLIETTKILRFHSEGKIQVFYSPEERTIQFTFEQSLKSMFCFLIDIDDIYKDIVELVLIYGRDIQCITDQKNIDIVDQCIHFLKYYGHI